MTQTSPITKRVRPLPLLTLPPVADVCSELGHSSTICAPKGLPVRGFLECICANGRTWVWFWVVQRIFSDGIWLLSILIYRLWMSMCSGRPKLPNHLPGSKGNAEKTTWICLVAKAQQGLLDSTPAGLINGQSDLMKLVLDRWRNSIIYTLHKVFYEGHISQPLYLYWHAPLPLLLCANSYFSFCQDVHLYLFYLQILHTCTLFLIISLSLVSYFYICPQMIQLLFLYFLLSISVFLLFSGHVYTCTSMHSSLFYCILKWCVKMVLLH